MDLRVLGPLEVRVQGVALPLGAPKQQAVLALLAVNAGRVVPLDNLVDELWPEGPPASAVENVRSYAANLRRSFRSVEPGHDRLTRRSSGYLLKAATEELDLLAFLDEVRRAREAAAAGGLASAARLFAAAGSRWRGQMLAGLRRGPALEARCTGIEEERLLVTEECAEVHLALGEPVRAAALLREHVLMHPLRERAQAVLIQALYQTGDTAGALGAYTAARAALVDQLGVEPGPELQAAHREVLRREPVLIRPRPTPVTAGTMPAAPVVVPRELPPEPGSFVGRGVEAVQLCAALAPREPPQRRRPAVAVVYGEGGVGKSALAVHVAHEVADRFPDGQLYLDLLGATPGLQPLSKGEALTRFLRSLGVPHHDAPSDPADAERLFRSLVADRRLLIVMDNARDSGQVEALLPASATCGVLITCRGPLAAVDADDRVRLTPLPAAEAVSLLRALTGGLDLRLDAAMRVAKLCDHLPLALRIAAGRMIGRPDRSPDEFAERLSDYRHRLDELELEGLGVRSCVRVGYETLLSGNRCLDQMAARAFRALGLLKVPSVTHDVVAAMLETDADLARAALDRLVAAQLIEVLPAGRYGLHDLVRLVAAEQAAEEDGALVGEEIVRRAMTYYLGCLQGAADLLRPGRSRYLLPSVHSATIPVTGQFASPRMAAGWVRSELPNLLAAAEQASHMAGDAYRFTLWIGYLTSLAVRTGFDWWRSIRTGRLILETAELHDDGEMAGWGHLILGRCETELGNDDVAIAHFEHALAIFADFDEAAGLAVTLNAYAIALDLIGKPMDALTYYSKCLAIARRDRLSALEGTIQFNLGNLFAALNEPDHAKRHLRQSLQIRKSLADSGGAGSVLGVVATVHCRNNELVDALRCAEDALIYLRQAGDRIRECNALLVRSEVHLRRGTHREAIAEVEEVLSVARADRYRYGEAAALRQLAKALAAEGDRDRAAEKFAEADEAFRHVRTRLDPVLERLFTETDPRLPAQTAPSERRSN